MKKALFLLLSLSLYLVSFTPPSAFGGGPQDGVRRHADAIPGSYIVVFKDNVAGSHVPALAARLSAEHGGRTQATYHHALRGFSVEMSEKAAQILSRHPLVAYVEEDSVVALASTTQTNAPWGLDRIDQRDLPLSGTYTYDESGSGVHAYIIDTGIRTSHEEFEGRASVAFDNVGDGQNGEDCHGHGSHVASIVGGKTWGAAKAAQLHAVRIFNCSNSGSSVTKLIQAIDWVTANHAQPAVAVLSVTAGASTALDTSVRNSIGAGVTYAIAAGNTNIDAGTRSPGRVTEAITVGATDPSDVRATFSNYGAVLDLFAPGVDIPGASIFDDTATILRSGTSMSAAHAAGVAARYLEMNPTASPAAVSQAVINDATHDKVIAPGAGSPNRLLYANNKPTIVITSPTDGSIFPAPADIQINADATDSGGTITHVEFYADSTLLGADTTSPYSLTWSNVGVGSYSLTAKATDDSGVTVTSLAIEITVVTPPDIYVRDAKIAEPAAGTANMVFTVALSQPAIGTLTINFTTADEPAGPGKAVAGVDYSTTSGSVSFAAGEMLKTISVPVLSDAATEPDETFLVNLTGATGNFASIADAQATGTITVNTPGAVLISELRTSGPGGLGDDFVEIYNNSATPLTVGPTGWALVASNNGCTGDPVIVGVIPSGTTIPARGHYLFVGSQYSLANYGGTNSAAGDRTLTADLNSDTNVALFSVADLINLSSAARLDAVGFGSNTGDLCDLLREGDTLGAASGSASEHSFVRELSNPGGVPTPADLNDNATDFTVISTTHTVAVGTNSTPTLGAPGPENLASPNLKTLTQVPSSLLDSAVSSTSPPNRVRTGSGNSGTLSIRRTFRNDTGGTITRLRLRFYDITAGTAPVGTADIRATSSSDTTANVTGIGTVTVRGTIVDTPPAQALGGGLNSSVTPTADVPLANGASINLQFLFNIQQAGTFRAFVIVEALP